jgi:hypothetical protein
MNRQPGVDLAFAAQAHKRQRPTRSIALLMLLVAVSSLLLAVGRGIMEKPTPIVVSTVPPVAVPAVLHFPPSPPAQPPDRFVREADAAMDPRMVVPAPRELDSAMVINPDAPSRRPAPELAAPNSSSYPPASTKLAPRSAPGRPAQ